MIGLAFVFILVGIGVGSVGCSGLPEVERRLAEAADGGEAPPTVAADHVEIVHGVPDRGRDPAVVALRVDGDGLCTGSLISSRLVLTARHCLMRTVTSVTCPATTVQIVGERDPTGISVLFGDDVASAYEVARGVATVVPSGVTLCDTDIGILVLDREVTVTKPLPIRLRGVAEGDRVRAVGFGKVGDDQSAGTKLLREHVRVTGVSAAEFTVGEATCKGDSGGPAIDQSTGEIVGVVSRGGPSCEGPLAHNIYTRADVFNWLYDEAFARLAGLDRDEESDGGSKSSKPNKGTKQKPPSDIGGPCDEATDCAAGVCVQEGTRRYCSRTCGAGDRCPAGFHCKPVLSDGSACVDVR